MDQRIAQARAAWPELSVPPSLFLERCAQLGETALAAAPLGDLYLACACALGQAEAISAFRTRYAPVLSELVARARELDLDPGELQQRLLERLFVAKEGRSPGINAYAGRGALAGWLRVAASRVLLTLLQERRERLERHLPVKEEELANAVWLSADPELLPIRREAEEAFRASLQEAINALPAASRALLKQHYVQGVGIDALGELLGAHRATAARQLVKARAELLSLTRRGLTRRLQLIGPDLDSVFNLLQSHFDVSVLRLLDESSAGRGAA